MVEIPGGLSVSPQPRNHTFPIGELVRRTRVPATSIHHYRRLGLLPPAVETAPNRFLYDERHVQAVRLVRLLRERRKLPLDVIRRVLPDLLAEETEAFRPDLWDVAVAEQATSSPSARDRLLAAAVAAFSERGFGEVSVSEISEAAGMGKGTVYRYFDSKEELFFAAADAIVDRVVTGVADAAAAAGGALGRDDAADVVLGLLEPVAPLLLELALRGLRRHPGHVPATGKAFRALAEGIGRHLDTDVAPLVGGAWVVERAVVGLLGEALKLDLSGR